MPGDVVLTRPAALAIRHSRFHRRYHAPILFALGRSTAGDALALQELCEVAAEVDRLREVLTSYWRLVLRDLKHVRSSDPQTASRSRATGVRITAPCGHARIFGLTPASRAKAASDD